jgi:hypothetical protein
MFFVFKNILPDLKVDMSFCSISHQQKHNLLTGLIQQDFQKFNELKIALHLVNRMEIALQL